MTAPGGAPESRERVVREYDGDAPTGRTTRPTAGHVTVTAAPADPQPREWTPGTPGPLPPIDPACYPPDAVPLPITTVTVTGPVAFPGPHSGAPVPPAVGAPERPADTSARDGQGAAPDSRLGLFVLTPEAYEALLAIRRRDGIQVDSVIVNRALVLYAKLTRPIAEALAQLLPARQHGEERTDGR